MPKAEEKRPAVIVIHENRGLVPHIQDVARRMALRPVYQPIFSLVTGRPIGFEGLVRPDAESSFRDAESLFTAAEVTGRTVELDMACLEAVAAGVGEIGDGPYLSFNISPRTLETDQFKAVDLVVLFRRHGIEPRRVVLELTERETVGDIGRLRENVAACRAAGFRLAADDVGAGNAGLRLLGQIRFDIVKIHLGLVQVGGPRGLAGAGRVGDLERVRRLDPASGQEDRMGLGAGDGGHGPRTPSVGRRAPRILLRRAAGLPGLDGLVVE